MDSQTEKELERVNKRVDKVEEKQAEQGKTLSQLAKDIMRFWHIGIGIAGGLLLDKIGIEKIISKLL